MNVTNLHKLKSLYLLYHKNIKGLETLKFLEKLIVIKANHDFCNEQIFSNWLNLKDVCFLSPKLPVNLSFLQNCKKISAIEIFNSRSVFDVSDLYFLKESLTEFKIGNCKKIKGLDSVLLKLQKLKWLSITDSIVLKNSAFVDSLPELNTLVVLGSSYFEDGNLTKLTGRFKHLGIDNKKHYNIKYQGPSS